MRKTYSSAYLKPARPQVRRALLLTALGVGAGVGAGCSGGGPGEPAAIVERLTLDSFKSCDELETYIEDQAVRDMQLQLECQKDGGWCGGGLLAPGAATADAAGAKSSGPSAYTKTNTQVAGVDEADFMKNDGTRIFVLSGQKLRAVKSWPADQLGLASSLSIEGYPSQMFLDEKNRVVVFSSIYTPYAGLNEGGRGFTGGAPADIACVGGFDGCGGYYGNTTKVTVVDVSDVTQLKVTAEYYVPGNYANSRRIGSSVRVVLSDWFRWPSTVKFYPDFSDPNLYNDKARWNAALDALKVANEKLIRAQTLEQWLPGAKRKLTDGSVVNVGLNCGDFYKSNAPVHLGLATVATLNLDAISKGPSDSALSRSSIVGEVGEIYASTSALYIASPHWWWWPVPGQQSYTYLHKFDLTDPSRANYVASGGVEGTIVDQFSMDEDKGYFRIATTLARQVPDTQNPQNRWGTIQNSNRITVLNESAGQLVRIGQSPEIAVGERIYSSRFVGDRGFVVTFRQIDPLFTFDLSRPTEPRQVGELKVPGFSTYIQPLDANNLLTIGVYQPALTGGSPNWSERRLQLSIFNVSDFKNPKQTFTQLVGTAYGWSDATYDHHAFNYFPERKLLAIPFSDYQSSLTDPWGQFTSDIRVFGIDTATGITPRGSLTMKDTYVAGGAPGFSYWYSPWIRRSVMATDSGVDYVYAVSDAGVRSAQLGNLTAPLATVLFPKEPPK
jgi:hypothetical protein